MICYKDKTFCSHFNTCVNIDCNRWISPDEVFSSEIPIAMADFKTYDCGYIEHHLFSLINGATSKK